MLELAFLENSFFYTQNIMIYKNYKNEKVWMTVSISKFARLHYIVLFYTRRFSLHSFVTLLKSYFYCNTMMIEKKNDKNERLWCQSNYYLFILVIMTKRNLNEKINSLSNYDWNYLWLDDFGIDTNLTKHLYKSN